MKLPLIAMLLLIGATPDALAQGKELKTEKDKAVVVLNLVNITANCQSGPLVIPDVQNKPTNGILLMQPRAIDVPAKGSCLAQKVPAVTLLYRPKQGFIGSDRIKIAIEIGDKRSELEYTVIVTEPGQKI